MICRNCGNEIRGKFCPHCGTLNSPDAGGGLPQGTAPPTAAPAWEGPEGSGKKKKAGLILGAAVAAAAAIALLVIVVGGLFSSPKQKLERAMIKSLAAYAQAGDALGLPDLGRLAEERSVSRRMSLRLTNLNTAMTGYDLSALEGLGLRFRSDLEAADRKLGVEVAAFWDDRELLSVQLAVDDAQVCLASSQLTGGDFYGVNTETLGEDLRRMGVQDAGSVSFNFFDLLDIIAPEGRTEEIEQSVKEAGKALFEAVQVEKAGKETISVNQTETKTDVYRVTVPKETMKDYVNAVLLSRTDYVAVCREVFRAMGVPENMLGDILGELEDLDPYGKLEDRLDELGGVVLVVHVGGGYVSAVRYEGSVDNTPLSLALYLGGGTEYVDDLRLEVNADGQEIVIDSSGGHGCSGGVFTDETTIRGPFSTLTSEFRYEPGKPRDNLSWEIGVPGAGSLEMAGQLTCGGESFELRLDELCLKVLGAELCSMEMDYSMGPCKGQSVTARSPSLIGEMDSLTLMTAALTLRTNALTWVDEMGGLWISRLPSDLFYAMTGTF